MAIRNTLRKGFEAYRQPGEEVQAVFLAWRPSTQYNDRAVIATDRRLCLLKLNFFARPTEMVAEIDRNTRLGPWQSQWQWLYRLPAFNEDLVVRHRFRADLIEADRVAGFEPEAKDVPVLLTVRSDRWKVGGVAALVVGWATTIGAVVAIMQIDGAANAQKYTPSQDAVGMTALVVGVGGAVFSIIILVRWCRRPELAVRADGVVVYQLRPVAVPWGMISEPPLAEPGSNDRSWGLRLVNGSVLRAGDLAYLPHLTRPAGIGYPPADLRWTYGAPSRRRRRARRCAELPGSVLAKSATPFRLGEWRWLLALPLYAGFLVLFPDGQGGAQSGVDIGGAIVVTLVFEAVVAAALTAVWVTLSRTMAVGETWVAWQPRGARLWRVLDFADLVSAIDLAWPRRSGVRLSRTDGGGVRLRPAELASETGTALRTYLVAHPALRAGQLAVSNRR